MRAKTLLSPCFAELVGAPVWGCVGVLGHGVCVEPGGADDMKAIEICVSAVTGAFSWGVWCKEGRMSCTFQSVTMASVGVR
jgi:hypothetical protein